MARAIRYHTTRLTHDAAPPKTPLATCPEMQQAPCRLSQTLWSAFRAARPSPRPQLHLRKHFEKPRRSWHAQSSPIARQVRFYSDKSRDVQSKVEDATRRIEDSIDSKADLAAEPNVRLKEPQEETIIKTDPVDSSIVEPATRSSRDETTSESTFQRPNNHTASQHTPPSTADTLRARFADFMDNFQSHLFTASRRLNDLTGYSTIEALKNSIAAQESLVQRTRQEVKGSRERYSSAIATRSTTQREVNDLLHRKHAWTPADLERFTNLYRSDHANEQDEAAAQKEVADAEARYEEASTQLGRAILARYHEEQVWSDKIRQMSTWGTWGLMGLNVLLFIVFQIMIEPWRRRRLVRGFEEKVELALQERDLQLAGLRDSVDSHAAAAAATAVAANTAGGGIIATGTESPASAKAEIVAETIAEQVADAVSGASPTFTPGADLPALATSHPEVDAAEGMPTATALAQEGGHDRSSPLPAYPSPLSSTSVSESLFASTASGYAYYAEAFRELWNEERTVVVTQREMTTHVLEGAIGGAALMGLLMALLRPR